MGFSVDESEAAARKHTVMAHAIDDLLAGKGMCVYARHVCVCVHYVYVCFLFSGNSSSWWPTVSRFHALQRNLQFFKTTCISR